jgi:DNA invertase Pin-like site-specific DNA recombinase
MNICAAIYARTSPDCLLTADEQIAVLRATAAEQDWTVTHVLADRPTSIKQREDRRPGEIALINAMRNGAINKVLIYDIDRIGKSLIDLVSFLETCRTAGASLYLSQQNIDSTSSNGLSLNDVSVLLAHHLRQSHRDRILRGQTAARSMSIRFGRPPLAKAKAEKAKQYLIAGKGVRQVARLAGISPASVSRLKNSMKASANAT